MQVVHLVAMNYSHNAARAASATLQGMSNCAPVMSRGKRAGVGQAIAAQRHHTGAHGQSNASMARYVLSKHDPEVGWLSVLHRKKGASALLVATRICYSLCACEQHPVLTPELHDALLLGLCVCCFHKADPLADSQTVTELDCDLDLS